MSERYVVTLYRNTFNAADLSFGQHEMVVGTFRSKARAERRAATIRRLANTYEDPEGVAGEDNCLGVIVEPLRRGTLSARAALDYLYGSL